VTLSKKGKNPFNLKLLSPIGYQGYNIDGVIGKSQTLEYWDQLRSRLREQIKTHIDNLKHEKIAQKYYCTNILRNPQFVDTLEDKYVTIFDYRVYTLMQVVNIMANKGWHCLNVFPAQEITRTIEHIIPEPMMSDSGMLFTPDEEEFEDEMELIELEEREEEVNVRFSTDIMYYAIMERPV
jgi:hypothetical protein